LRLYLWRRLRLRLIVLPAVVEPAWLGPCVIAVGLWCIVKSTRLRAAVILRCTVVDPSSGLNIPVIKTAGLRTVVVLRSTVVEPSVRLIVPVIKTTGLRAIVILRSAIIQSVILIYLSPSVLTVIKTTGLTTLTHAATAIRLLPGHLLPELRLPVATIFSRALSASHRTGCLHNL
jgi:hypothetical protein